MCTCRCVCAYVCVCVHARAAHAYNHTQVLSTSEVNSATPKAPNSNCYHTERTISSSLFDHFLGFKTCLWNRRHIWKKWLPGPTGSHGLMDPLRQSVAWAHQGRALPTSSGLASIKQLRRVTSQHWAYGGRFCCSEDIRLCVSTLGFQDSINEIWGAGYKITGCNTFLLFSHH